MKSILTALAALFLFSSCGFNLVGTLRTHDGEPLAVNSVDSQGRETRVRITQGRLKLTLFDGKSLGGARLEIKAMNNRLMARLPIAPDMQVYGLMTLSLPASMTHQDFDISMSVLESRSPVITTGIARIACQYQGFCARVTNGAGPDGDASVTYGNYPNCAGKKDVIQRVITHYPFYRFAFRHLTNPNKNATFDTDPRAVQDTEVVRELTECRFY